jgi:hypothetical protein
VRNEGSSFSGDDSIVCALLESDSEDEGDLEDNFPTAPIMGAQCAPQDLDSPRYPTEPVLPCVPYKIRDFDVMALSTSTNARPRNANNSDKEDHPQHETVPYNENVQTTSLRAAKKAQSKQDSDTASKERNKKHHSELYYSMMMAMLQAEENTTKSASPSLALTVAPNSKLESPINLNDRGEKLSIVSIVGEAQMHQRH